jgi:hypothetical protein
LGIAVRQRTVVLDQPFERLPGEIEPIESGVAPLERGDDPQGLGVVVEAAGLREAAIERALAGMAERRMPEVMRQRQRFAEVLVEPERTRQRAGDLRDFERVGEPGAEVIALVEDEWMIRSQSRRKSVRVGDGGSGRSRPRLFAGSDA